jgi:hypothetical protein
MNDGEFSDIEIFQHSGKGIPLFIIGRKHFLQADYLLGPGPRLTKNNLPGRSLTKFEKHCSRCSMFTSETERHVTLTAVLNGIHNCCTAVCHSLLQAKLDRLRN